MSKPPVFLLLSVKLKDADSAFLHMTSINSRQEMIRDQHAPLYSIEEHAEILAVNLQAVYTKLEGILGDLIKEIDGDLPRSESWHKDLLVLAANPNDPRPPLITGATYALMVELLGFRHVVRSRYASELRPSQVFKNFKVAQLLMPSIKSDIEKFVAVFGEESAPTTKAASRPKSQE